MRLLPYLISNKKSKLFGIIGMTFADCINKTKNVCFFDGLKMLKSVAIKRFLKTLTVI